jgi:hypothetical protein
MHLDSLFPLDAVSPRARNAILRGFKGRCPSIQEAATIPDSYWLSTPGIGAAYLEQISSVTHALPQQINDSLAQVSDAELLEHLERLREELHWLHDQLKEKLSQAPRRLLAVSGISMQDEADCYKSLQNTAVTPSLFS